jgi:hypothetical protein
MRPATAAIATIALLAAFACDRATGVDDDFVLKPGDFEVEVVEGSVPLGSALQLRFTNHTDRALEAGWLAPRVDIWPDDRLWAVRGGALFRYGGLALPPGETVLEIIDVVETLPPGTYSFDIEVAAWEEDDAGPSSITTLVTFTVTPSAARAALD